MNIQSKSLSVAALVVAALTVTGVVLADMAPVVSATPASTVSVAVTHPVHLAQAAIPGNPALPPISGTTPSFRANLTPAQRITQLERQMQNFTGMNLPQQISDLQNQIQQLRGQFQVQAHDLKLLNSQQRSFYQDVDSRIAELKNLVSNGSVSTNSSASPAKASPPKAAPVHKDKQVSSVVGPADDSSRVILNDTKTYQAAFKWVRAQKLEQAHQAFSTYLVQYPMGRYVANAHYWLGEIYIRQSKLKQAISEFQTILNRYPKSNKVSDATLKLAMIDIQQGHLVRARQSLIVIQRQYAGTTAAQLAAVALKKMDTH